jgi:hypothetical protein
MLVQAHLAEIRGLLIRAMTDVGDHLAIRIHGVIRTSLWVNKVDVLL